MRSLSLRVVLCSYLLAAAAWSAANPPAAAAVSDFERFNAASKRPVDWLSWGADLRIRDEYFENSFMLVNPEVYNQLRVRTRLWTTVEPWEPLAVGARMSWELRSFSSPDEPVPAYSPAFLVDAFEPDEFILDNLYVRLTNLCALPLTVTVGRQDVFFGNGWLVGDGTPRDGSRTYFLDAARVQYEVKDWHTTLQALYVDQGAESDRWLKPINAQAFRHYLTEQNERGAILYASNRSISNALIEGFFIYKNDDRVMAAGTEGDIYAFGARTVYDFARHWRLRAEVAPEFGEKNGRDLESLGFNALLTYLFRDRFNTQLRLGYEYLSGDDPETTDTNERFDILWGRWPQWSELLVYNLTTGPRPVEWGNLHRLNLGVGFQPHARVNLSADYHCLFAPEDEQAPLTQGGNLRGQLLTGLLEYTPGKHLKTHLRAEGFWPGDYYDGTAVNREPELFLRGEMFFTW